MAIAADYPFLDIFWSMILFFTWVVWIWMMVAILGDVFRRRDLSGWSKAAWTAFLIVLPFLGALIYLVTNSAGMAERSMGEQQAARARYDSHAQSASGNGSGGGAAAEITAAVALRDSGGISQSEFEALKAKALA